MERDLTEALTMPSTHTQERTERLEARITRGQKALFKQAAELQGSSLTDFIVRAASDAATRLVQERQVIALAAKEQAVFVQALLTPPAPGPRLRAAARRHRKIMGR